MQFSPHAAANLLQFAFMSESDAQDRDIAQDRVTLTPPRVGKGLSAKKVLPRHLIDGIDTKLISTALVILSCL